MYVDYRLEIDSAVYQQMEELRKSYLHESMTKEEAKEVLTAMGLPISKGLWNLYLKYQIIKQTGKTKYTRYLVSTEQYSMHTLERMEEEYNKGKPAKKKVEEAPKDKELGRTKLSPKFCRDYLDQCDDPLLVDFCIEQLKKRGNYMIFEVTPQIYKLKAVSLEYLIQCSDAERK